MGAFVLYNTGTWKHAIVWSLALFSRMICKSLLLRPCELYGLGRLTVEVNLCLVLRGSQEGSCAPRGLLKCNFRFVRLQWIFWRHASDTECRLRCQNWQFFYFNSFFIISTFIWRKTLSSRRSFVVLHLIGPEVWATVNFPVDRGSKLQCKLPILIESLETLEFLTKLIHWI